MSELSFTIGIEYIRNISSLVTLCINHLLSLILKVIPNLLPEIFLHYYLNISDELETLDQESCLMYLW